jgi:hypothetical protein
MSQATIEKCRKIVEERQCARVQNTLVDLYTASAIVTVYDHLNPQNKSLFAGLPLRKMAGVAFKLCKAS